MSRTIIASVILVLCLTIAVGSLIYIENACNDMITTVDMAMHAIMTQNEETLTKNLHILIEKLEQNRPILNVIMGQDETIELRGNLNQAIYYCNCNDYETALLHLQEYKTNLNRIISLNEPTPSTIF